jgi:hypothetical protein
MPRIAASGLARVERGASGTGQTSPLSGVSGATCTGAPLTRAMVTLSSGMAGRERPQGAPMLAPALAMPSVAFAPALFSQVVDRS